MTEKLFSPLQLVELRRAGLVFLERRSLLLQCCLLSFHMSLELLGLCLDRVHATIKDGSLLKDFGNVQHGDHATIAFLSIQISSQRQNAGYDSDDF